MKSPFRTKKKKKIPTTASAGRLPQHGRSPGVSEPKRIPSPALTLAMQLGWLHSFAATGDVGARHLPQRAARACDTPRANGQMLLTCTWRNLAQKVTGRE